MSTSCTDVGRAPASVHICVVMCMGYVCMCLHARTVMQCVYSVCVHGCAVAVSVCMTKLCITYSKGNARLGFFCSVPSRFSSLTIPAVSIDAT